MKNTTFLHVWLLILTIIVLVFGFVTVDKLTNTYNSLLSQISAIKSDISSVHSNLSAIESNIRQEMEKQSSLLVKYEIKEGDINTDDLTMSVTITVIPKEYKETTNITVTVGDTAVQASINGNAFTAETVVSVLKDLTVKVSIETDGVIKNEVLKEKINGGRYLKYKAKADMQGPVIYKKNKLTFENNDLTLVYSPFKNSSVSSVRLFATIDGNEIWERDITNDFNKSDIYSSFVFSKTFDIEINKEIYIFADITESNGIKYRLFVKGIKTQKDSFVFIESSKAITVYDKNGNEINLT